MARVFETPTYENQTAHSIVMLSGLASEMKLDDDQVLSELKHRRLKLIMSSIVADADSTIAFLAGHSNVQIPSYDDHQSAYEEDFVNEHIRYCYAYGTRVKTTEKLLNLARYGYVIQNIFWNLNPVHVYTDFEAVFMILLRYLKYEIKAKASDKAIERWRMSELAAENLTWAGCAVCNIGKQVLKQSIGNIRGYEKGTFDYRMSANAAEAWEKLRLSGGTRDVHEAHEDLHSSYLHYKLFRVKNNYAEMNLGFEKIFKVAMFTFLKHGSDLFILDSAHLEMVRAVMRTWEGLEKYAMNFRLLGDDNNRTKMFEEAYRGSISWLINAMSVIKDKRVLAKSMKHGLAILQNNFHSHAEKLEMGLGNRNDMLWKEQKDIADLKIEWYSFLSDLDIPERDKVNLAYLYHILPSPDAPPKEVYERVVTQLNDSNKEDVEEFATFLNYCKATDVSMFVTKSHGKVKLHCKDGYDPSVKKWYKSCAQGKLMLPPKHEWGLCWIKNVVPVNLLIHTWYLNSADVTRVVPDISKYDSLVEKSSQVPMEVNELLYTLMHAPDIEPGWSPELVLECVRNGSLNLPKIADMSVKSENTKYGPKMRETWSADAITRELLTDYDHSLIGLSHMVDGVTSRKSNVHVDGIFDKVNRSCVAKNYNIIISNDTSGWSPSAPREAWAQHHDYKVSLTSLGDGFELVKLLDGIHAGMAKRGFLAHDELKGGLFQGWTGTADSLFNVSISTYCVRKGKEAKYLPEQTRATTAGLIDDAVQSFSLPDGTTKAFAQNAANKHYETTRETWGKLGASLSESKTIYSSIKFIYLNRFFCEGSEVLVDMKTFSKVDRDYNRRLSTFFQASDTVMGGYRSSAMKGSDPMLCYYWYFFRSFDLMIQSNAIIKEIIPNLGYLVTAAFAPRSLNGLGMPHIVAFMTKEKVDALAMFFGVHVRLKNLISNVHIRNSLIYSFSAYVNQKLEPPTATVVFKDPMAVYAADRISPDDNVYRTLKARMRLKCKSPAISEAFDMSDSLRAEPLLHAFLSSVSVPGGILEAMSASFPEQCIRGLVDKAHKGELLFTLFPFSIRRDLVSRVKGSNAKILDKIIEITTSRSIPYIDLTFENYLEEVISYRASYHALSGYKVPNCTVVDPGTMLSRRTLEPKIGLIVEIKNPLNKCKDRPHSKRYANLYDGISPDLSRTCKPTATLYGAIPQTAKNLPVVAKCLLRATQVVAHLSNKGIDAEKKEDCNNVALALWKIFCVMWNLPIDTTMKTPTVAIKPGVSFKRFLKKASSLTHPISAFPNSHRCAVVMGRSLIDMYEYYASSGNVMSLITAAKVVGLLEGAIGYRGFLYYSVVPGSMYSPVGDPLQILDRVRLHRISQVSYNIQRTALSDIMAKHLLPYRDLGITDMVDGDVILAAEYTHSHAQERESAWNKLRDDVSHFYYENVEDLIHATFGLTLEKKQQTGIPKGNYDIPRDPHRKTSVTKLHNYSDRYDKTSAALRCLIELLQDSIPRASTLDEDIYVKSPRYLIENIHRYLPNWEQSLDNAIGGIRNAMTEVFKEIRLKDDIVLATLGTYAKDVVKLVHNPKYASEWTKRQAFVTLLYAVLGKFQDHDIYMRNARADPKMIERAWSFAAKRQQVRFSRELAEHCGSRNKEFIPPDSTILTYLYSWHLYDKAKQCVLSATSYKDLCNAMNAAILMSTQRAMHGNTTESKAYLPPHKKKKKVPRNELTSKLPKFTVSGLRNSEQRHDEWKEIHDYLSVNNIPTVSVSIMDVLTEIIADFSVKLISPMLPKERLMSPEKTTPGILDPLGLQEEELTEFKMEIRDAVPDEVTINDKKKAKWLADIILSLDFDLIQKALDGVVECPYDKIDISDYSEEDYIFDLESIRDQRAELITDTGGGLHIDA
uniref:RNA-dependent RNA polymerase n=1 Tax=Collembolan qin-related virus OKIAV112 TaxID=2746377 RepID=A0A7D7J3S3_9VIRU|nr:RNA-dependent RNA polymerase [Collembolan qin-related virus OKIAV112]